MALACALLRAGGEQSPGVVLDASFRSFFTTTRGAVVFAAALQADEKLLIAGDFTLVDGFTRRSVARLDTRGRVDPGFDAGPGVDGLVYTMAVSPGDGRILLGGEFTQCGGRRFRCLARLLPNGEADPTFHPRLEGPAGCRVTSVVIQPDGRILVGGKFESADGLPRRKLTRLMPSGEVDRTFDPGPGVAGGLVHELVLQADGRILVAGSFTQVDGRSRQGLARLGPDGRLDETFVCDVQLNGMAGTVFAVALDAQGGIVLGGDFDAAGSVPNVGVARLAPDGAVDASFDAQFGTVSDGNVPYGLAVAPDGQVIATGAFWFAGGVVRIGIARLGASGAADPDFDPGTGLTSRGVAFGNMALVQADGRVIVVGQFEEADGTRRHCVARFLQDGTVDPDFSTSDAVLESAGAVHAIAPLPDGGWVVGGDFERVKGGWRQGLACLDKEGGLRAQFDAKLGADAEVRTVAIQPGGELLVGGWFEGAGDHERSNFARLRSDGSVDAGYAAHGADGAVRAILALPDGGCVVAGEFRQFGDLRRLGLVRLGPDGEPDLSFEPRFEIGLDRAAVHTVTRDVAGRFLVGGYFDTVNGEACRALARLLPDGSLDRELQVEFTSNDPVPVVHAIAVRADGRILIGGGFGAINRQPRPGIARLYADGHLDASFMLEPALADERFGDVKALALLGDGQLLAGGRWGSEAGAGDARLLLLSNSGLSSPALAPLDDLDGEVRVLAIAADGRVLTGGGFSRLWDQPRFGLARLTVPGQPRERRLAIMQEGGRAEVHWDGEGRLLEAADLAGPWHEVPEARSPEIIPADAALRFYRWAE